MATTASVGLRGGVRWHDTNTGALLPSESEAYRPVVPPKWSTLRGVDWVCGHTLDRVVLHVKSGAVVARGETVDTWLKLATENMLTHGCDRCAGPHNPKNTLCSQTLGVPTAMTEEGVMYDCRTGKKLTEDYQQVEYEGSSRRVHKVVYQRV